MDLHIKAFHLNHRLLSLYDFRYLHYSVTLSSRRWNPFPSVCSGLNLMNNHFSRRINWNVMLLLLFWIMYIQLWCNLAKHQYILLQIQTPYGVPYCMVLYTLVKVYTHENCYGTVASGCIVGLVIFACECPSDKVVITVTLFTMALYMHII